MGRGQQRFPCDVLVMQATFGLGHRQVAAAVVDAVGRRMPGARVTVVDFLRLLHPMVAAPVRGAYAVSLRCLPGLWGTFYRSTADLPNCASFQRGLNRLGRGSLRRILAAACPRVIVCVYPTPAGVLGDLRLAGWPVPPVVTVVTDHAAHAQWLHPATTLHCVSCEAVAAKVRRRGIPSERIAVTGIPLRQPFTAPLAREEARRRLGIDQSRPVVLLMPGPGRRAAMRALAGRRPVVADLTLLTPEPEVALAMAAADLVVTKAGGVTTSEASAVGTPLVLFRSLPGQEGVNAALLTDLGAAVAPEGPRALRETVAALLADPTGRQAMAARAQCLGRPDAAERVAEAVLGLVG